MFAQIADRFGTLHILVNNAALVQKAKPMRRHVPASMS